MSPKMSLLEPDQRGRSRTVLFGVMAKGGIEMKRDCDRPLPFDAAAGAGPPGLQRSFPPAYVSGADAFRCAGAIKKGSMRS